MCCDRQRGRITWVGPLVPQQTDAWWRLKHELRINRVGGSDRHDRYLPTSGKRYQIQCHLRR
ncbi:hypothetical protein CGZ80_06850 [Rhodopirellula sp. MGV]|nr:hypothetical protein CGZ80_06850 [Rhodopirellula sp. MGV]PNY36176.1 hypothetical protein C2E31_13730 [Rhodopirellula baltica]